MKAIYCPDPKCEHPKTAHYDTMKTFRVGCKKKGCKCLNTQDDVVRKAAKVNES